VVPLRERAVGAAGGKDDFATCVKKGEENDGRNEGWERGDVVVCFYVFMTLMECCLYYNE
jgi:hypothetical protein